MVENKRIAVASTTISTSLFLDTAFARNDPKNEQSFLVARTAALKAPNAAMVGGRVYKRQDMLFSLPTHSCIRAFWLLQSALDDSYRHVFDESYHDDDMPDAIYLAPTPVEAQRSASAVNAARVYRIRQITKTSPQDPLGETLPLNLDPLPLMSPLGCYMRLVRSPGPLHPQVRALGTSSSEPR